jgi:hypothetical protein
MPPEEIMQPKTSTAVSSASPASSPAAGSDIDVDRIESMVVEIMKELESERST